MFTLVPTGDLYSGGLYSGGLIFGGGAYIWNDVSVSTCGGLIHGGGLYSGGLIVGGLRYHIYIRLPYIGSYMTTPVLAPINSDNMTAPCSPMTISQIVFGPILEAKCFRQAAFPVIYFVLHAHILFTKLHELDIH